jgi:hypothetical protein
MQIIKTYHDGGYSEIMTLHRTLLELTIIFPTRLCRAELDAGDTITTRWATYRRYNG